MDSHVEYHLVDLDYDSFDESESGSDDSFMDEPPHYYTTRTPLLVSEIAQNQPCSQLCPYTHNLQYHQGTAMPQQVRLNVYSHSHSRHHHHHHQGGGDIEWQLGALMDPDYDYHDRLVWGMPAWFWLPFVLMMTVLVAGAVLFALVVIEN
ncbi:hypothetical protein K504DRAFT_464156 [Pleomassaria siparia CBS 279.74]|uniref:Uncharacterized protein n=1 Tax=Pleomassaria siparia CBS 279.74 TaxID=1314801 RepID=A0A6G1KGU3_9PLEO|nr:hypothetical protein K504DRAFT_464156 [Pleomassaria siparia CBS 279.74]